MTRYEYKAQPTPRKPRELPSKAAAALFAVVMAAILIAAVWYGLTHDLPTEAERRPARAHDSLAGTYTYDGEIIRWYVFVDPDSGLQYLVNDRGGCVPRYDRFGYHMGQMDESDEGSYE